MKTATRLAVSAAAAVAVAVLGLSAKESAATNGKRKRSRVRRKAPTWEDSPYGKLLLDCRCQGGTEALTRFRGAINIPYDVYCSIYESYIECNPPMADARGQVSTSTAIKVMVALSFLSNASQLKILSLLSNLSAEVCRKASIKVIGFIEQQLFPKKVLWPTVHNGLLDSTLKEYNAAGLPGCIGSIDCTHVHWDKCPASHRSLYLGKEKFPTAAFQVVSSHSRRILSCTKVLTISYNFVNNYSTMYKAFPGTYGDATIIKYDPFVASIASGAYDRYTYRLYDAAGDSYMERGCYLICDQGYGECRYLVPTAPNAVGPALEFSDHIESTRKVHTLLHIYFVTYKV
jgi:hypothetical protein